MATCKAFSNMFFFCFLEVILIDEHIKETLEDLKFI